MCLSVCLSVSQINKLKKNILCYPLVLERKYMWLFVFMSSPFFSNRTFLTYFSPPCYLHLAILPEIIPWLNTEIFFSDSIVQHLPHFIQLVHYCWTLAGHLPVISVITNSATIALCWPCRSSDSGFAGSSGKCTCRYSKSSPPQHLYTLRSQQVIKESACPPRSS